jgi:hypothetical protein
MATIGVIETTVSTEVASTSTSFTEVVESSALTSGTIYYIVCHIVSLEESLLVQMVAVLHLSNVP